MPDDAEEELGQQRRRPAPAPGPGQAGRHEAERNCGPDADDCERDAAVVLVGPTLAGRDAGQHGGGQDGGGLYRLHEGRASQVNGRG